jgi:hypothetical protein
VTDRYALTRTEAARSIGMGLTTFEIYVQPHLKLIRVGRKVLIPVSEIERWTVENADRPLRDEAG